MSITYRQLAAHEAERIKEIDNTIRIKRVWRKKNGIKQWIDVNWQQDSDFPEGYENHLTAVKSDFESGGFVVGAFNNEQLIGFCAINRNLFGNKTKYVLLDQMFISAGYRRMGIGKKMFFMCAEQAKLWGADKFYICAGSSEETLNFYIALGCENAKEVNQALYEQDENDIQLEYDFNTMPLSIKSDRLVITKFYETMAESTHVNSLDKDNRQFVPDEVFETVAEAQEAIAAIVSFYAHNDAPQIYAVHLKDGQHIGHVQAVPIQDGWEIGYHIAKPFTGHGYATEAVNAFLPAMMHHLGITEIYGITHAGNIASRRVLEKCGFVMEYQDMGQYQGEEQLICKMKFAQSSNK